MPRAPAGDARRLTPGRSARSPPRGTAAPAVAPHRACRRERSDILDVEEAIGKRRAYRALEPVEISDVTIGTLAEAARLAASCYNNQPWRFVFVRSPAVLERMRDALSRGNEWAHRASCIVAVFGAKENDCVIREREYYLFDIGMAVSAMVLRATGLGLVAHPIAGFSPSKVKEILGIPGEMMVITLVIVGRRSNDLSALSAQQRETEAVRPARRDPAGIYSIDSYDPALGE